MIMAEAANKLAQILYGGRSPKFVDGDIVSVINHENQIGSPWILGTRDMGEVSELELAVDCRAVS